MDISNIQKVINNVFEKNQFGKFSKRKKKEKKIEISIFGSYFYSKKERKEEDTKAVTDEAHI